MKVMHHEKPAGCLKRLMQKHLSRSKMFGSGKKHYYLMTTVKGKGKEQINKSLSKEINTALGKSKTMKLDNS